MLLMHNYDWSIHKGVWPLSCPNRSPDTLQCISCSNNYTKCHMGCLWSDQQLPLLTANNLQHGGRERSLDLSSVSVQTQSGLSTFQSDFRDYSCEGLTNSPKQTQSELSNINHSCFFTVGTGSKPWGQTNDPTTKSFMAFSFLFLFYGKNPD